MAQDRNAWRVNVMTACHHHPTGTWRKRQRDWYPSILISILGSKPVWISNLNSSIDNTFFNRVYIEMKYYLSLSFASRSGRMVTTSGYDICSPCIPILGHWSDFIRIQLEVGTKDPCDILVIWFLWATLTGSAMRWVVESVLSYQVCIWPP